MNSRRVLSLSIMTIQFFIRMVIYEFLVGCIYTFLSNNVIGVDESNLLIIMITVVLHCVFSYLVAIMAVRTSFRKYTINKADIQAFMINIIGSFIGVGAITIIFSWEAGTFILAVVFNLALRIVSYLLSYPFCKKFVEANAI